MFRQLQFLITVRLTALAQERPQFQDGHCGGAFSSTAGLNINSSTGAIDLVSSVPGTYTVTYTIAAANGCATYTTTTNIQYHPEG